MKAFMCILIISIMHCEVQSCKTILQSMEMSSVDCDYTSDPVNCTVTCDQGYMFDDGSTSRVYQCENSDRFSRLLYRDGCLRRVSPTLKMKLFVVYKLTQLARNCIDSHKVRLMDNQDFFNNKITTTCNQNNNLNVGNIFISNATSTVSSFEVFTTFEIRFENVFLSQDEFDICAQQLLTNTRTGANFMYANSLQCLSVVANVSFTTNISIRFVNVSTTFCPTFYYPTKADNTETHCEYVLPLIGVKHFTYVSDFSSNVTLFCEVSSSNSLNTLVYWEHNYQEVIITSRFHGSTFVHPSLTIYHVTNTDSGRYTCNARNEFGTSSSIPISLTVQNETFDVVTARSSGSTAELSTQGCSTLQEVLSEEKENTTDKALMVVSIVAAFGWTLALILAVIMLYKRKQYFSQLRNEKNTTLTYSDLNELSDVSRYSALQTKTMMSEQYDDVTNQAEYANSFSIK